MRHREVKDFAQGHTVGEVAGLRSEPKLVPESMLEQDLPEFTSQLGPHPPQALKAMTSPSGDLASPPGKWDEIAPAFQQEAGVEPAWSLAQGKDSVNRPVVTPV